MAASSDHQKILKEWYRDDRVMTMILQSSPGLALLSKKMASETGGKYEPMPLVIGDTGGHGPNFATAQANKGAPTSDAFNLTTGNQYALATLPRKLKLQSGKNMGAFLPAARTYIDSAFRALRRDLAVQLYRDGSGARGRVLSFAAGVITLTQKYHAVNFGIGDKLEFSANKVGTAVDAVVFTITAINTTTGTLTGTSVGAGTIDANDWIFGQSEKNAVYKGMAAWFLTADPTPGEDHFGVDRSANVTMLAGVRSDGTGKLRYEAAIDLQSDIGTLGDGDPTIGITHPSDMRALIKEMEAQVTRPKEVYRQFKVSKDSTATVGFSGIQIQGDRGSIEIFADRFQEPNTLHMLEGDTCGMLHVGPMLADIVGRSSDDGMLTETSSDGYEIRIASYPQFYSRAPGHSGVCFNFGL